MFRLWHSRLTLCAVLGAAVTLLLAAGTSRAQAVISDDFDDNAIGDIWYQVERDPSKVSFDEANQRLELISNLAPATDDDEAQRGSAFLVLRQRRLDTSADFLMKVDYDFAAASGENASVSLGVGKRLSGKAAIHIGHSADVGDYIRVSGVDVPDPVIARKCASGVMRILYDATLHQLRLAVLAYSGADEDNKEWTVDGFAHGEDDNPMLMAVLDGAARGATVAGGQASLDNFAVIYGALVAPPTKTLDVQSFPTSASIGVRPADNNGEGDGMTEFTRIYDVGIPVVLTAPGSQMLDGTIHSFYRWIITKHGMPRVPAVQIVMNRNTTALALYANVRKLKITGPLKVTRGDSAQYVLTAFFSDGTSADVTNLATWKATGHKARFTAPGLLQVLSTSKARKVQIIARFAGKMGHLSVRIDPSNAKGKGQGKGSGKGKT